MDVAPRKSGWWWLYLETYKAGFEKLENPQPLRKGHVIVYIRFDERIKFPFVHVGGSDLIIASVNPVTGELLRPDESGIKFDNIKSSWLWEVTQPGSSEELYDPICLSESKG